MNGCTVAFDLETIANREIIPLLPDLKPKANLKDEVKIFEDLENKKKKRLEELGLDSHTNTICCASFMDVDSEEKLTLSLDEYGNEKDLLVKVWEHFAKFQLFVSFNGKSFDVEVLKFHSMMNNVPPSVDISQGRYDRESNHVDVRMVLGNNNQYAKGSQDFYTRMILGEKRTQNGAMVQGWWDKGQYKTIRDYCEQDVSDLVGIYKRLEGYYI